MTNIALSTMLNATPPLGYESLYFDRAARRLRGGVGKYIGRRTPAKIPSSYMEALDYQEPLPFEFLVYVAPEAVWRADLRRFREEFDRAPQTRHFFAFIKATDGLLHIRGRKHLDTALESLNQILQEIHAHYGADLEIVLFSDHGMNLEENRRIHLQTHLRKCGYTLASHLNEKMRRSVAIPAFGLCGYAAIYCAHDEMMPSLAEAVVELMGVDLALYRERDSTSVMVMGRRGMARINRQARGQKTFYRYEQMTGDPLQLASIIEQLRTEALLDERDFASDQAWYQKTTAHVYPDALANLYAALHDGRVQHTADLLLNLEDGYYFGATIFSRFVKLAATHGNALPSSTSAFLMSTHRTYPAHLRANCARNYFLQSF
jgi:hypothetical protein